jgi:hypothetical protein
LLNTADTCQFGIDGRKGLVGHIRQNVVPLTGNFSLRQDKSLGTHNLLIVII